MELSQFINENYKKITFGEVVNMYMYQKNMTTTMLCQGAGVDRKLISKFISDSNYHPSKDTVLAVAIGLKLEYQEARQLMKIAGYSLSRNNIKDLVVIYALKNHIYHINEVNNLLEGFNVKTFKANRRGYNEQVV